MASVLCFAHSVFFSGSCALFTGPVSTFKKKKKIKTEFYDTIYTFKNYFVIIFSVFSF